MLTELKNKKAFYLYCWGWNEFDHCVDQMKTQVIPAFWEKIWYEVNRAVFIGVAGNISQIKDLSFPIMRQLQEEYKC